MSHFIVKSKAVAFMNRCSTRNRAWVCLTYYRSRRSVVLKIQLHDTQARSGLPEAARCYYERSFRWNNPAVTFKDPSSSVSRAAQKDRLFHLAKKRQAIGPGFYSGWDLVNAPLRKLEV